MKLTKEQITYIDDYLKHHKVKYWDFRIELLDHIVTTVEEKMEQSISFDDAMIEVHKSFGNKMTMFWNSEIEYGIFANGLGYEKLMDSKRKETNKKYRKLFYKEIKAFFKKPMNIIITIIGYFLSFFLSFYGNQKLIKTLIIFFVFIPGLIPYFYPLKMWIQKRREKSLNLEYALFHAGSLMMLLNLFFQLFSPKGAFHLLDALQFKWLLIICTPLFVIINYCGFKMYERSYKYFNELYDKLQSL